MIKKQYPAYFFVAAIFLIIISPNLFSNGMFMDGLIYSVISKNLANGSGNFWDLHFTETIFPHFHEHPPLALGLEAVFFKILGDGILTERLYSLLTFIITGIVIIKIMESVTENTGKSTGWLALFFWISIPTVVWAASNNMLENTMMIFTSLSVLFAIKSLYRHKAGNLLLSGFMLFLGFMCKGFTSLFPLSFFFWLFVFDKNFKFKQFFYRTAILMLTIILSFGLMFLIFPESYDSMLAYFNKQVVGGIVKGNTVDSRFYIVKQLLMDIAPMMIIALIIYLLSRKIQKPKPEMLWVWVFIALGVSGVLPIMISMKQRGFYILAALPFFAIAVSVFAFPAVSPLADRIKHEYVYKIFKYLSIILLITGIGLNIYQIGRTGRDKEKIDNIYRIAEVVPHNSVISVHKSFGSDWAMHGYFSRFAEISLDRSPDYKCNYLIVPKGFYSEELNPFEKQHIDLSLYDLYMRKL